MTRPPLPAAVALPALTDDKVREFDQANALLSLVVARYSALIAAAADDERAGLLTQKDRFVRARRFLSPCSSEKVRRATEMAREQLARWDHGLGTD